MSESHRPGSAPSERVTWGSDALAAISGVVTFVGILARTYGTRALAEW